MHLGKVILILSAVMSTLYAQYNFSFYCRDDTIQTGETLIEFHFTLENTGTVSDSYEVDCRLVDTIPGWFELFCAGGSCAEPGEILYDYLLAGETDTFVKISVWPAVGYGVETLNLHVRSLGNQAVDSVTVYAEGVNSVKEMDMFDVLQIQMAVVPNPVKRECNVLYHIPVFTKVDINLINAHGIIVKEVVSNKYCMGIHREKCDMTTLPQGVYFIRLEAGGVIESRKVIWVQ